MICKKKYVVGADTGPWTRGKEPRVQNNRCPGADRTGVGDKNLTGGYWALHKESESAQREPSVGGVRTAAALWELGQNPPFLPS